MQLKNESRSIRHSLSLATGALLGCVGTPVAGQEVDSPEMDVQVSQLLYSEENRVTVNKFEVKADTSVLDDSILSVDVIYDSMTGASPNGRRYQSGTTDSSVVPITTASGFTFTTANTTSSTQKQSWLSEFKDARKSISLEWEQTIARIYKAKLGLSKSVENDYDSSGASGNIAVELFEKNTTLSFGGSIYNDTISPVDGVPEGLGKIWCTDIVSKQPAKNLVNCDDPFLKYKPANKINYQYLVGLTQVWNSQTLFQLNLGQQFWNGYLTDPYKQISVIDASQQEVSILYEKRPDYRLANILYLKWVQVINDNHSFNMSYRYFWDSWKIAAHTVDVHARRELGEKFYLQAHFRGSRQSAAVFYRSYFDATDVRPNYVSADHRLSAQDTATGGLKFGYSLRKSSDSLAVRADYMYQRYRNRAIPHMKAWIIQFLMQVRF